MIRRRKTDSPLLEDEPDEAPLPEEDPPLPVELFIPPLLVEPLEEPVEPLDEPVPPGEAPEPDVPVALDEVNSGPPPPDPPPHADKKSAIINIES